MLLHTLQCTGQPPPHRIRPPTLSTEPSLGHLLCAEPGDDQLTCLQADFSGFSRLHSVLRLAHPLSTQALPHVCAHTYAQRYGSKCS